jgi:ankyrin repeat protein
VTWPSFMLREDVSYPLLLLLPVPMASCAATGAAPEMRSNKEYFNNKWESDVVFRFDPADDGENPEDSPIIYGHKHILSLKSEAFRVTFEKSSPNVAKFVVKDIDFDVFETMIKYFYTDEFDTVGRSIDFFMDVLAAASKFRVTSLVAICSTAVSQRLEAINILHVVSRTDDKWTRPLSGGVLRKECMEFVKNLDSDAFALALTAGATNGAALVETSPLKNMDSRTVAELLLAREDGSALFHAVRMQLPEVFDLLLHSTDSSNAKDLPTGPALKEALQLGSMGIVQRIVMGKAFESRSDETGDTVFHLAAEQNNCEHLQILLDAYCGEDNRQIGYFKYSELINAQNNSGLAPIHVACAMGNAPALNLLLDNGAIPNIQDRMGNTALHICSGCETIQLLLERRRASGQRLAGLEFPNHDGRTPLHIACLRADVLAVSVLLESGAMWNVTDNTGNTPMHLAAMNPISAAVILLLTQKAEEVLLACSDMSVSSTCCSVKKNQDQSESRINSGTTTITGSSFTPSAASIEELKTRRLTEMKHLIHPQNDQGNTPLHIAASVANTEVATAVLIAILENHGRRSLHVANVDGDTPLHKLVAHTSNLDALHTFERYRADLNRPSSNGDTPLHRACKLNNSKMALALIERNCPPNIPNNDGEVALDHCNPMVSIDIISNLQQQPTWGHLPRPKACMDCGLTFGLVWRPYHCSHCGRAMCDSCTLSRCAIPKFNKFSPVRVCTLCCDVLEGHTIRSPNVKKPRTKPTNMLPPAVVESTFKRALSFISSRESEISLASKSLTGERSMSKTLSTFSGWDFYKECKTNMVNDNQTVESCQSYATALQHPVAEQWTALLQNGLDDFDIEEFDIEEFDVREEGEEIFYESNGPSVAL